MSVVDYLKMFDPAGCARKMELITKADGAETGNYRGFFIAAAATLKLVPYGQDNAITVLFPAGYNPIMIKQVWSTGSDAVDVYGLL